MSHDYDFARLLESKGWPPKLVLLKTGNIDNDTTAKILINAKSHITDLYIYAYGLLEIE